MLAYRNSAALQESSHLDWGDGVVSNIDQSWKGHSRMSQFIKRIQQSLDADDVIVCMSSDDSFRRTLCPSYKENRNDKARPEMLTEFKNYLKSEHNALTYEGLEADDVMGILATTPSTDEFVLATIDKDLRQIPGWYYNPYPVKGKPKPEFISCEKADDFFFYQTLVGDVIDGYKGCRGIGPKKAEALIKQAKLGFDEYPTARVWEAVVKVYVAKGMTEADALMNARMARILRHEDWNKQTGVKLWTPPTT